MAGLIYKVVQSIELNQHTPRSGLFILSYCWRGDELPDRNWSCGYIITQIKRPDLCSGRLCILQPTRYYLPSNSAIQASNCSILSHNACMPASATLDGSIMDLFFVFFCWFFRVFCLIGISGLRIRWRFGNWLKLWVRHENCRDVPYFYPI